MSTIARTATSTASGVTVYGDLILNKDGIVRYDITVPGVGFVGYVTLRTGDHEKPTDGFWVTLQNSVIRSALSGEVRYFETVEDALLCVGYII